MGLNVCKRIINVYNGELAVTSELGVGSKFSFSFVVKDFKMEKDPDSENENDNQISLANDDRTSKTPQSSNVRAKEKNSMHSSIYRSKTQQRNEKSEKKTVDSIMDPDHTNRFL